MPSIERSRSWGSAKELGSITGGSAGFDDASVTLPRDLGRVRYELQVAPLPPGTVPAAFSTPAPARKWNWRSGVFSERSLHQNAPASTMLEETGPDRNRRYSVPAQSF